MITGTLANLFPEVITIMRGALFPVLAAEAAIALNEKGPSIRLQILMK